MLRIEDTDRARSKQEAVDAILDGLTWLGLDWDGDPISQFARADRHRECAEEMVQRGTAYYCTCTPDEVEAMRQKAREEGQPPRYDGRCRERYGKTKPEDMPYVIRLKSPEDGETIINDQVQGVVKFPNKDLDDLVLLRADGAPTYMLAVVVDDHDMAVSHIIRGDDHLTNAARQSLIYQALGWDIPVMAHVPLIHGPDGAKLSKRHGAIGAEVYRSMGYLPDALRNYLVRLGWAHGDEEIMSVDKMIEWFGFTGMNKAAARFDYAKLDALNSQYLRTKPAELLLEDLLSSIGYLDCDANIPSAPDQETHSKMLVALDAARQRGKTLIDMANSLAFLFDKVPLSIEEKAEKFLDEPGMSAVRAVTPRLDAINSWDAETIGSVIKGYAEENGLGLGKVAQPLRAALTGRGSTIGAFDVLLSLGREESLNRLNDMLNTRTG